ncbi:nicotinamide-nucleotide amidase [Desulfonispora thiosulfatigenes DSM 11270]|uniref:Putative competence-damage inducible protein n=1 Tax=Desulfonispora thiosulfatigenes DSM 11270 TaxID=656914 RepID=A0A1W1VSD7_DESTI|nr:competence/damage-inducible protein A [Desulfonispora thiosulfatigenes]SMB96277.1 nicotinamide-nucleotide amidase [Desulfonispora thiosulfatigenes DSM 11270]
MRCEIITVGTELLLGDTIDTNSAYIAQELAKVGVDVFFQSKVGDNSTRLKEVIKIAQKRADLLIFTGGLGPTEDDITKQVLAEVLEVSLYEDENDLRRLQKYFAERNLVMSANNRKQVLIPEGAKVLENKIGTASGVLLTKEEKNYILLPGPPSEMKYIFSNHVIKWLESLNLNNEHIMSENLKFIGISESRLENELIDLMHNQTNPTLALYVKKGEIHCRVTAKVQNKNEFLNLIAPIKNEILKRVGEYYYGSDELKLEEAVGKLLLERNLKLVTAESCTGGLIAQNITQVPGSSEYFLGGVVSYSNTIKENILKVDAEILNTVGAVSEQTAIAMAKGALDLLGADIAVSTTGIAGPGGATAEKPIGLTYIGLVSKEIELCEKKIFFGDRQEIRANAATYALNLLRKTLIKV